MARKVFSGNTLRKNDRLAGFCRSVVFRLQLD